MLYSIEQGDYVNNIPHELEYIVWKSRLAIDEIEAIIYEIKRSIRGNEIKTAGWIPGSDWTNTVFEPIYSKACLYNMDDAAKCFGLFVWEVMMNDDEVWSFGRYEIDCIPVRSLTYFKVHP